MAYTMLIWMLPTAKTNREMENMLLDTENSCMVQSHWHSKNQIGKHTLGVNTGWAVVDEANNSCCKLWIRVHLTVWNWSASKQNSRLACMLPLDVQTLNQRLQMWNDLTYNSLMHLFLSSGSKFSRSDWRVAKSDWRLDICWIIPGTETYVDKQAWVSERQIRLHTETLSSKAFKLLKG